MDVETSSWNDVTVAAEEEEKERSRRRRRRPSPTMSIVIIPKGTDTELLRVGAGPAKLSLACAASDGGRAAVVTAVQEGDFAVYAVGKSGSALAMLVCLVGEHHWPLARDSPVLRVGPRKFSFAFPGFFYGLALPEGCSDEVVMRLEMIFATSCSYEDHAGTQDSDFCDPKPETDFWASAYAKIKKLSVDGSDETPIIPAGAVGSTTKLQRALRTSAATKLVAKVLLKDAIDPDLHVDVVGPARAAARHPSEAEGEWQESPHVFASLRAVSDVVDAVEAARGIGAGGWSMAPDRWAPLPESGGGGACWHFNVAGLTLVLRAVAAVASRAKAEGRVVSASRGGECSSSLFTGSGSGGGGA